MYYNFLHICTTYLYHILHHILHRILHHILHLILAHHIRTAYRTVYRTISHFVHSHHIPHCISQRKSTLHIHTVYPCCISHVSCKTFVCYKLKFILRYANPQSELTKLRSSIYLLLETGWRWATHTPRWVWAPLNLSSLSSFVGLELVRWITWLTITSYLPRHSTFQEWR